MIAMFRQHTLLAERAAFNGIDISQYMEYPPQTIKKILKALEDGYSKKGIDQWVENRKDLERYLDDLAPTENAAIFAHDLLNDINLPQRIPDMRKQIRKWDLIFPGDSYLGWSSDSIHFTKDKLQRYVDENDPEAGKNTSLFIWADSILQNRNDPIFLLKSLKSFELANSELCYGMHTAEYLACYVLDAAYALRYRLVGYVVIKLAYLFKYGVIPVKDLCLLLRRLFGLRLGDIKVVCKDDGVLIG